MPTTPAEPDPPTSACDFESCRVLPTARRSAELERRLTSQLTGPNPEPSRCSGLQAMGWANTQSAEASASGRDTLSGVADLDPAPKALSYSLQDVVGLIILLSGQQPSLPFGWGAKLTWITPATPAAAHCWHGSD